jgi:hypothetical protein
MLDEARKIFLNADTPLHQRIDAASLVLQHDAPEPGLVDDAAEFLTAISKSDTVAVGYRLDAIKALAKRTVPKAAAPGVGAGGMDFRRLRWRQIASHERQLALMRAGEWPPAPAEEETWDADLLADDWICPDGFPPGWEEDGPEHGGADFLRAGRKLAGANILALTEEEHARMREREREMNAIKDAESAREEKEWYAARRPSNRPDGRGLDHRGKNPPVIQPKASQPRYGRMGHSIAAADIGE